MSGKMKTTKNPLRNPRVTEKATDMSLKNVYVFNVSDSANKKDVEKAVFLIYKVKPIKVNILKIPHKKVNFKGKVGKKGGGKKAFVYLKEGDKLEFI